MPQHDLAIVPLECWGLAGPELADRGIRIDTGLLCEALLYYDRVALTVSNQQQFADLISWLQSESAFDDFLSLVAEGVILIYDYAFFTAPIASGENSTDFQLWNIQDPVQEQPDTWEQRVLYHPDVEKLLPTKARHRIRVYSAFRGHVLEVKASAFGPALENARADFVDPARTALTLQTYLDTLYSFKRLGTPPVVSAHVVAMSGKNQVTWNVDFDAIKQISGANLKFGHVTPLYGAAISNRLLWSAAQLSCDLFVASPMGHLLGDKLAEAEDRLALQNILQDLEAQVEFPDVRGLVNQGSLPFAEVLKIRKKAVKFRRWLQEEGERDRNAIIAYHQETAVASGLSTGTRRALSLFGVLGGGALGAAMGAGVNVTGAAIGGATGAGVTYLADLAAKFGAGWKPVVFGQWLKERIRRHLDRRVR